MRPSEREAKIQLSKIEYSWEKVSVLKQEVITRDDELELQNGDSILCNSEDGHNSTAKGQIDRVHLSPTIYQIGDWVKFKRGIIAVLHGWLGTKTKSVGDQHVRLTRDVKEPRFSWCAQSRDSVGTVLSSYEDGILPFGFPRASRGLKADPTEMEREEGSIKSLVNSLRMELEEIRREREELQQREAERLEAEERKKAEALKEESLKLEEMKQEALGARNEAEEINRKIESLKKETDAAMIAAEEAEKRLELVIREMEEAKAAEEKVREEMKMISQEQEIHTILSITQPRLGRSNETSATIGRTMRINIDGILSVHVTRRQILWKVSHEDAELLSVCEGGDWVYSNKSLGTKTSYDWFSIRSDSIAVDHNIQEADYLNLAGCFQKRRWSTHYTNLEKIPVLHVIEFVHFEYGLTEPRSCWRGAKPDSRGNIIIVHADGEVRVVFFELSESGSTFKDCDHVSGHEQRGDTLTRVLGKTKLREMRNLIGTQDFMRKELKLKGDNVGISLNSL